MQGSVYTNSCTVFIGGTERMPVLVSDLKPIPVWIVFSVVGATSKEALSYQIILFDVIGWQSQVVKILNILVYVVSLVDSS